ncbi:MAG: 50S ribosomal protein L7/L12 [Candidatus Cloacimonadota bacterium]|nr:MAG: 50S ribosomal protein L7/L12 [Candidatus Cloacimonadota bacterium]PIE78179.1 MAG: 50S ribosomal protein L7/L12 [Candidatus Delongbacteria bacterium]
MISEETVQEILDKLENMTALELSELVKAIEDKFGVTAAAPTVVAGGAVAGEAQEEEKSEFDVVLISAGDKKIQVIKAIREITGLGLKEAKAMVDGLPATVKEAVAKDDAEKIKAQIEEVGGQADLK